jgi:hypothetical protein
MEAEQMSERNRRGGRRDRDDRGAREFKEREYGRDEPWREERRTRYPDEIYGRQREYGRAASGRATNRGDYRSDFGPEGYRRFNEERPYDSWQGPSGGYGFSDSGSYRREHQREPWRSESGENWVRSQNRGGFGSEFGAWQSGASARFGEELDYSGRGPKDYRRSDDRIREEICDRLTDDRTVDASEIVVKVEQGEVTLTGSVSDRQQKRRAEDAIEAISGVRDVINQLRVSRGVTGLGQQAQQDERMSQPATRAQRSSPQQASIAAEREK